MGFNSGPPMTSGAYNNNVQILQTPGYVTILNEMVHNARIIPLDRRPHGTLRQYAGDSRGRWEGNTLVVETTNFIGGQSRGTGPNMHLVERFTRIDPDTVAYEFTVTDETVYTQPYTALMPLRRTDGTLFEYACHEGNYGLTGILAGARPAGVAGPSPAPLTTPVAKRPQAPRPVHQQKEKGRRLGLLPGTPPLFRGLCSWPP